MPPDFLHPGISFPNCGHTLALDAPQALAETLEERALKAQQDGGE